MVFDGERDPNMQRYWEMQKKDKRLQIAMEALERSLDAARLKRLMADKLEASGGVSTLVIGLLTGLAWNFAVVGGAAVVGGIVFGVALSEVPILGTAGGATFGAMLGATIANYVMMGVGIIQSTQLVGFVMGAASVPLEAGARVILNSGSVETAADYLAQGWIEIAMMLIPILMILVLHKGFKKIEGKISSNYLNSFFQRLPPSISNFKSSGIAKRCGLGFQEFHSMKAMSKGRFILIRACNPARRRFIGMLLEGKPMEIKAKTVREGVYSGCVALDDADLAKLLKNYTTESRGLGRKKLVLKDDAAGEMSGWTYERVTIPKAEGNRYIVRDANGNLVTGDIDRLAVMEFNMAGRPSGKSNVKPKLEHIAKCADDPNEIAWWNNLFNRYSGKRRANADSAKHGYSSTFLDKNGNAKWNASDNETLLLFSDGLAFEMKWNDMVLFMRQNQQLGTPDVFKAVLAE